MGLQLPNIVLDNDVKIYFPEDHESYIRMQDLDDTFESQIMLDICLTNPDGSFIEPEVLSVIQEITSGSEDLDHVDGVTSIVNADFPDGSVDGMIVESLVPEGFTGTAEELAQLKWKLQDWPDMYENSLYSEDFKTTQILLTIDEDINEEQMSILYYEVMDLVEGYDDLDIRVAGDPVLTEKAKEFMYSDLSSLIPLVILVLLICLYLSFHSLGGTLLPMITVMVTTIWTVALMSLFDFSFTVVSTCLPVLIIAIGSAYGIHVLNHYYAQRRASKGKLSMEAHRDIVADSVKHVFKPVLLAGFTTVVGFSSIMTSPIGPLKAFGLFSSIGVFIALVLSLTFIPALVIVSYRENEKNLSKKIQERKTRRQQLSHKRMENVYDKVSSHTGAIIAITVVVLVASFVGLNHMNIESALIEYFPKDSSIRVDSDYISENLAGTNTFNVVISGDDPTDVIDPAVLSEMDGLKEYLLAEHEAIGKIISYSDFIKRMNQIMNFPVEALSEDLDDSYSMDMDMDMGIEDDSFSSFFTDDSAETTSFFDEEERVVDTDSADSEGTFSTIALDTQLTWAGFVSLTRDIVQENSGKELSIDQLATEIAKACNYRGMAYYEIPEDPAKYPVDTTEELKNLISQYLLLYSGSLDAYSDDILEPNSVRMLIQITSYDTAVVAAIIDDVNAYAAQHFPENITVENTGLGEMTSVLTDMVTGSQIKSLLTALVAVFLIVSIAYRSPVAGIFGVIPLSLSILINFGIMGAFGINLDMVTSLIASIAIGVGVDYTIHFISCYKSERLLSKDLDEVTRRTVLSTGKAIITNAVSVGLGFAVLIFSQFIVLRYIGILVAIIMFTSSVAALTVLPVMLNLFKPKFISRT